VQNGFSHRLTHKHFKHSCAKLLILFKCCPEKGGQEVRKKKEEGKRKNSLEQAGCLLANTLNYICNLHINQEIFIIFTRETTAFVFSFLKAAPG